LLTAERHSRTRMASSQSTTRIMPEPGGHGRPEVFEPHTLDPAPSCTYRSTDVRGTPQRLRTLSPMVSIDIERRSLLRPGTHQGRCRPRPICEPSVPFSSRSAKRFRYEAGARHSLPGGGDRRGRSCVRDHASNAAAPLTSFDHLRMERLGSTAPDVSPREPAHTNSATY
jgi:hypothetical protein